MWSYLLFKDIKLLIFKWILWVLIFCVKRGKKTRTLMYVRFALLSRRILFSFFQFNTVIFFIFLNVVFLLLILHIFIICWTNLSHTNQLHYKRYDLTWFHTFFQMSDYDIYFLFLKKYYKKNCWCMTFVWVIMKVNLVGCLYFFTFTFIYHKILSINTNQWIIHMCNRDKAIYETV